MKAISGQSRLGHRGKPATGVLAILLAAGMVTLAGCGAVPTSQVVPTPLPAVPDLSGVTAEGRLEPIRFATLSVSADGLVSAVRVKAGDQVQAGQVIALLDSTETQTLEGVRSRAAVELSDAHEAVRVAQKELDAYPVPKIFVGLTAEQTAQTWLDELDSARADFEPYEGTSRKALKPNHHIFPSLPRRIWFDTNEYSGMAKEYKKQVDVSWTNYRKAVDWLTLNSALETAQARLLRAQKNYDDLQDASLSEKTAGTRAALATSEVRAPFGGTIASLDIKLGEHVSSGEAVATIGDFSQWLVKTIDLAEIDVVRVKAGEPANIALDALPDRAFDGRILTIDENYSERQGDIVYTATILLAEHDDEMRWGMTAQVTFAE